ncbi:MULTISPECIES: exodeoxyribonuclease VII large subunit [Helcococcus]|uniref:Exodeoxyribonuclease 7 large subunit n=1 Tax=Helcococcus bovis TaxID=3153252 RepID=A0ABW9F5E0_9FIRM
MKKVNAITVKQLSKYLKTIIKEDFILNNILIIGEIVNLRVTMYSYFSLKEDDDTISCVKFDNDFNFKEGDKVLIRGSLNLYTRDSRYQIIVKEIDEFGIGENSILLKKLKEKLLKKGYFDDDNKKLIPKIPYKIGLITGLNSAAYFDFFKVLNDNNYDCEVYYYNALVQGKRAEIEIVDGLKILDNLNLDLIVLTRGGGSKDDLSIFNSEIIADSIFKLNTPIITAIGHDIDLSIADLVGDKYVSTPTKAAEYIIKYNIKYKESIINIYKFIDHKIHNIINNYDKSLKLLNSNIELNNPKNNIIEKEYYFYNKKNKINYLINETINNIEKELYTRKNKIDNLFNKILNSKSIYIRDKKHNYIDIKNIKVGNEYIIFNNNISYRIKVEEKIYE